MNNKIIFAFLLFVLPVVMFGQVHIVSAGGWHESAYTTFTIGDYENVNVYAVPESGEAVKLDKELVRTYDGYVRADAVGLTPGKWTLRIVPVSSGDEQVSAAVETDLIDVTAFDRSGFAHHQWTGGVGAYKDNGTLKDNAIVLYLTRKTAKTMSAVIAGAKQNPCVGIQHIIDGYQKGVETRPLVIRVLGTIFLSDLDSLGSSEEGLQIKGRKGYSPINMTIEGIGDDATFKGFGLLIRNSTSVEVRNLGFMRAMDDGVSMDTENSHIWLHNCDFFYGKQGSGDHIKGDGSADTKAQSTMVTVSYNHFFDTGKTFLCGQGTESADKYVTYHHNWFDHSDSRHPRVRTMSVHVYNNYYDGNAKYGIGATMGASIFAEANYFRNTKKPMLISMQGTDTKMGADETNAPTFSNEDGGIIKAFNNVMTGSYTYAPYNRTNYVHFDAYEVASRAEQVPSNVVCKKGGTSYNNFDTDGSIMYSYSADAASDVPSVVTGERGAGRLGHGDFKWSFPNSEDTNYELITALSSAIDDYSPSATGILGGDDFEPAVIDEPQPGSGGYECYFTGGKPSSNFYTIVGSYSTGKGTATVNGVVYDTALKMESSTIITFTTSESLTLYLVFAEGETGNIKVDSKKYTSDTNVLTIDLEAGTHTILKGDSRNLFYINLLGGSGTGLERVSLPRETAVKVYENGIIYIVRDGVKYTVGGAKVR